MLYKIIGLTIAIIILAHFFELEDAVRVFFERIADIPAFSNKGTNPAIFDLAVRLAYLIAIIGAVKLILVARRGDEND